MADRGNDYVTTYMQSILTLDYKRKERKGYERKGKRKIKRWETSNN